MANIPLAFIRRQWQSVLAGPRRARTRARLLVPESRYYLLASVPFVVAFGIVPFALYAYSGEEWAFDPELLLRLAGLGLLALVATVVALRLIAVCSAETMKALSIGLFCLGVFTLFAHVYAPIDIGPLDGGKATSDEPLSYTLLESFLLVGATFLFYLLWRSRGLAIASLFGGALWLAGLGYLLAALWPAEEAGAEGLPADINSLSSAGSCEVDGNIYHIVLDALATDATLKIIHSNNWVKEFDGFDLFENNTSNYVTTVNSMASYLTGRFYHSGDLRDWQESRAEGLFRNLTENRFSISMYAGRSWMYAGKRDLKKNPYIDVFRSNVGVYRERIGALEGELYEFLSVWLTSLAPNVLTNEMIPVASKLADYLFTPLTWTNWRDKERLKGHRSNEGPALRKNGFNAVASTLLLEQVTLDEPVRGASCQYVYAHALLPHDPFVVDGRCRYAGEWQSRSEKISPNRAYLQQTKCALRKVIDFLRVLKRSNRYDSATIVLHGDHGTWHHLRSSSGNPDADILGWPRADLLARVQALLMIKRPHARHRLEVVKRPTQLVDIYPTVFDVLGLELQPAAAHGRSVYAPTASSREARFALDAEKKTWYGPNLVEVRIDDPRNLANSNLTVIGPPTDPSLWRAEIRR